MDLKTAKQVFSSLMQKAREKGLSALQKRTLIRARQTIRKHAKPAMNAIRSIPKRKHGTMAGSKHSRFFATKAKARAHLKKLNEKGIYGVISRIPNRYGLFELSIRKAKSNPHGIKIYGRCLRIEAIKLVDHTYGGKSTKAGQHYFHDFSTKNAVIYGMPDGSLRIVAK